jgi:signal peptidase II
VATGLILTVALAFLLRSYGTSPLQDFSLALIIGGGIGNFIDRSNQGWVIDFIRLGVGPVHTRVFNVADAVIMAGMIIFVVSLFRATPTRPRPHG